MRNRTRVFVRATLQFRPQQGTEGSSWVYWLAQPVKYLLLELVDYSAVHER